MSDVEVTIPFVDGAGNNQNQLSAANPTGNIAPETVIRNNGAIVSQSNPLPVDTNVTAVYAGGSQSVVGTGGLAIQAIAGPVTGGYIVNPLSSSDQAVTAEPLYVDPVNAPGLAANGTTIALAPGSSWYLPTSLAAGGQVRVNATTSGHRFTVVTWT